MVVFDRAYNYYHLFSLWTRKSVFLVTLIKNNAVYTVAETLREHKKEAGTAMVQREEIIEIEYCPEDENGKEKTKQKKTLRLKKICYQDEKNRYY